MAHLASQTYRLVAVAELEPHPNNPHRGDVEVIGESIDENGFFGAVLVQRSRMRIIAGEHRWRGAMARGLAEVPCVLIDVDDERARRILLADNRTAALGYEDPEALAALLASLDDLAGTGYSDGDLADVTRLVAVPDLDEVVEMLGEPTTRDGWVAVRLTAPRPVNAAWKEATSGREPAQVLAELLGVEWQWDDAGQRDAA
ncbi:ParB N-terminal domain-containing protein [Spongiactinospora sp. TRM90649]|uniref:ParB/RepB/Spo0J family partition protein n=1 Tax=Spongiactinospora sp. TRM90649 TaxID=3031114 RepID=UPI0023F72FDF|nr:ParB N-terminal domain-containing protein [Spongiactinospora sp. TRM90649]MDF5756634.1 ParB N-terminal domain-containing protein [Spongiactinospora sp. TRM90649]